MPGTMFVNSSRREKTHVTAAPASSPKSLARLHALLSQIPHFQDLPAEVEEAIFAHAAIRHFSAGQIIYLEGEPAESIYILERGWIKATRMTREGREQAMLFLRPVDIFGDIAAILDVPYPGTVVTLEDVAVWEVPSKAFLDLVRGNPDLSISVTRHLAGRVLHYVTLVEDLSLRGVEARLAGNLLRNAELHGDQLVVPRRGWTTFDEMAVRLGTVRDVLSRALKTLEAENLITVEKQAIVIHDPKGLAERANL